MKYLQQTEKLPPPLDVTVASSVNRLIANLQRTLFGFDAIVACSAADADDRPMHTYRARVVQLSLGTI